MTAAELRLEEIERRAALIVESALDAIVTLDTGFRIVGWNRRAEEMFGWPAGDILGRGIVETVVPPDRVEPYCAGIAELLTGNCDYARVRHEGKGLHRDGSVFPIEVAIAAIRTGDETLIVNFVRDLTAERDAVALLKAGDEKRRRLLAKLVRAQEEERQRIAGDIHDDSVQVLTALALRLEMLRRRLDDPTALAELTEAEHTARLAITRLRHLMFELRPPVLDRDGLGTALEMQLEQVEHDFGVRFRLDDELDVQPGDETRALVYRIAQEAILNAAKHANASLVEVTLRSEPGSFVVRVVDDGRGFELDAHQNGHLGLVFMRERAEMAGGWCRVESSPGNGTVVEFAVPANGGAKAGA